jgi:hypothetical protein
MQAAIRAILDDASGMKAHLNAARSFIAFATGGIAYLATLFRGLSYSERNNLTFASYLVFALLLLAAGFGVAFGQPRPRFALASWAVAGVWAGHAWVINLDWRVDPTDHNLLPFEFVLLAIAASPAYLGVALARLYSRAAGMRAG